MVLWNCGHPSNKVVDQDFVNEIELNGAYMHRFSWLKDEEIGSIDHTWNYLVGVYDDIKMPKLIHYTEGGPWFPDYRDTDYATEWFEYLRRYEATLKVPRLLCPYERFSQKGNHILRGYENSDSPWTWEEEEEA